MVIKVLRIGHRPVRDKRISTHVALTARAFGAEELLYTGVKDPGFEESVNKVVEEWGGEFDLVHVDGWKKVFEDFDGDIVHLTMYGERLKDKKDSLTEDILLVVGGSKVPSEVYKETDFNISIGNQPHSEVSALAVFLYERFGSDFLYREFKGAEKKVIPHPEEKRMEELD